MTGSGGADNTFIVNSSSGKASGTITSIRETGSNAFAWDTKTGSFELPVGTYSIYAGMSADATFGDNTTGPVSKSSNQLVVEPSRGITPHMLLSPTKLLASAGDTLTFEVLVQSNGGAATSLSAIMNLPSGLDVVTATSPFTDLGLVFPAGTVLEDTTIGSQLRFSKTGAAEIIGTADNPTRLASFMVVVQTAFEGRKSISFDPDQTAISINGRAVPLKGVTGMSSVDAELQSVPRGRILATVLLEGRTPPLGNGNHATLLNVHLRLPGSTIDVDDAVFRTANDDFPATTDTVEVQTESSGDLTLSDVPFGRYVLTVKDTSHLSGRTDTLTLRNGETLALTSSEGLFASDIRGDPSFLLDQGGRTLKAGDATGDNEIDEDDINAIDAAWGLDASKPLFAQADLNNDGRVGVEDLAAAISNISNTTGFGAPPVFKTAESATYGGSRHEGRGSIEVMAPDFADDWLIGEEVALVFMATDLINLAGYSLDLSYDPMEMEILDRGGDIEVGRVFSQNREGFFSRRDRGDHAISVAAARQGKEWAANGRGELLRMRIRLFKDGFPASLKVEDGKLLSSAYQPTVIQIANDPSLLAVPREFSLRQNYPNPFNPSTTIPFQVPAPQTVAGRAGTVPVEVEIFNILGQNVRTLTTGDQSPGYYRAVWDGRDNQGRALSTGIYFYSLRAGEMQQVRRMTLVK